MGSRGKHVPLPQTDTTLTNENQSNSGSKRISFYDNFNDNGLDFENSTRNEGRYELQELNFERERSPTQVYLMNTTVPQNIGDITLGDRHAPTRNSLRHSRMIVMSRNGNVPKKYLPPIIRYHKLAKGLLGLQTLLGIALATLSLWLLLWAPNIRQRDNPYWSAIPLLLSGIIGLALLCCCRKEYPGMPNGFCVYSTKVTSIFLSTVAGAVCLIACAFAIIHLTFLYTMYCAPFNELNSTCFCQLDGKNNSTTVTSKSFHYVDLSCPEVNHILSILIIFSCGTNGISSIIAIWYVYLHWVSRYSYTFSKVKTKRKRPIVINNSI